MKRFEVGKRYSAFSPCDMNCTWEFEVVKRTEKMITISPTDNLEMFRRVKVHQDDRGEWATPLGSYSMCPVLRADE